MSPLSRTRTRIIKKIIYARKNIKKCKNTYILLFFILMIRFNSQKCIIFASRFVKRCKINNNFLNIQIMANEFYVVELINKKNKHRERSFFISFQNACLYAKECIKPAYTVLVYPAYFSDHCL